ncbi:MAG TPA: DUF4406 domain-containing protein [Candidatus Woesearchaeota archaeon]|nr:DUF4406 domain-containing protein [Candidatus Woesearchaeota archaeon]
MKIFLGDKFTGANNKDRLETIKDILNKIGHTVFVGPLDIDDYGRNPIPPEDFMKLVFEEIKKSDIVLIKHTKASTGMGIESGYAKALGKKLIVLYPSHTEQKSNSLEGIADNVIEYSDFEELKIKLIDVLE